jgi:hypothetical protein
MERMMVKKQAHLSDLLKTGKEVVFDAEIDGDEVEIKLWMRKPVSAQHDEAVAKARGALARRKAAYRDKDSDEFVALQEDLDQFDSKDELVEQLLRFEESSLKNQAYNEVLYDEDHAPRDEDGELLWGEQGEEYLQLLNAMAQRMGEIQEYNKSLGEQDSNLAKSFDDDEELVRMDEQRKSFDDAVEARFEELAEVKRLEFKEKTIAVLQKDLKSRYIDLDGNLSWHDTYQKWMLFFTCRLPEDHSKRYFQNIDEIDYLPPFIQQTLINEMDELDQGIDNTKNLLSLQRSSS